MHHPLPIHPRAVFFQCSSASRKFLNIAVALQYRAYIVLSVLFSEPKIPQSSRTNVRSRRCGSFSALQRAENSSIVKGGVNVKDVLGFQCSSASRKFLNSTSTTQRVCGSSAFSALQRAENSSIPIDIPQHCARLCLSVLFSEPKIPQFDVEIWQADNGDLSVLFSEPKIPQCSTDGLDVRPAPDFQCSSASRKFLNDRSSAMSAGSRRAFSALQRAENSSIICVGGQS